MRQKTLWLMLFLLCLVGCYPEQVRYQWGWTTTHIEGTLQDLQKQPLSKDSFIIAQSYYSQFVTLDEGTIHTPKAVLIRPDAEGRFVVPFDTSSPKILVTFIAPKHRMHQFAFQRQLGVGDLSYQATLARTSEWKNYLFLTVAPFLERFIVDERYDLPEAHQLELGQWLAREKVQAAGNRD